MVPAIESYARNGRAIAGALAAVALLALLAWISAHAVQRPPSFDGAMNLQVSWSLAEGDGYRRTYASRTAFPIEIQTNAPFTVPAAAFFKVFGMGLAQAQATSLLYLLGLCAAAFWILKRRFGFATAGAGTLLLLVTPGIMTFGLNGYGEVPALFWALAALAAFPWGSTAPISAARTALAGVCLGLALATKTVLLICCATFGIGIVVAILTAREPLLARRLLLVLVATSASLLPLTLLEIWRIAELGGIAPYLASRLTEFNAILAHSGNTQALAENTSGLMGKLEAHASLLGVMYGLSQPLLALWLSGPLMLAFVLGACRRTRRIDGVLACILVAAAIYLAWWLILTPSEKAWHRRILNGTLLLNLGWAYVAALSLHSFRDSAHRWVRALAWVPAGYCALLAIHFFSLDLKPTLRHPPETEQLRKAVAVLEALPTDAKIFGLGWQSAPVLSLLSRRPFADLNDTIIADIGGDQTYLAVDQAMTAAGSHQWLIDSYRSKPLLPAGSAFQIFAVDFAEPIEKPASGAPRALYRSAVDFTHEGPEFAGGFSRPESGGRWMNSDAFLDLKYGGEPVFALDLYTPAPSRYIRVDGIEVSVRTGRCLMGREAFARSGVHRLRLRVPDACQLQAGELVRVRVSSDNLLDSPITKDDRALAAIMLKAGFVPDCSKTRECDEWESLSAPSADSNTAPRSEPLLEAMPASLEHCGEGSRPATWIRWDTGTKASRNVKIWVSAQGQPRKLWIAAPSSTGTRQTGKWLVDGMRFDLRDSAGALLASTRVRVFCKN